MTGARKVYAPICGALPGRARLQARAVPGTAAHPRDPCGPAPAPADPKTTLGASVGLHPPCTQRSLHGGANRDRTGDLL